MSWKRILTIAGLCLAAHLAAAPHGKAQTACLSEAESAKLLDQWASDRNFDTADKIGRVGPVLLRCPTLTPSGAVLLRIWASDYVAYPRPNVEAVRSRLGEAKYDLEVLELDWRRLLAEAPSDTPRILEEARRGLGVGGQGTLRGRRLELASRLALHDQAICEAAMVGTARLPTLRTLAEHEPYYWTLYCAARWRPTADLTGLLSAFERSVQGLEAADDAARATERLFAVAAELRNEAVLASAQRLAIALAPRTSDGEAREHLVLGEVVALLVLGRQGDAEAAAQRCATDSPAGTQCHLARLAPGLWRTDADVTTAMYNAYLAPLEGSRGGTGPYWREAFVLPIIRHRYVENALTLERTLNADKILSPPFNRGWTAATSPVASVSLDCTLARLKTAPDEIVGYVSAAHVVELSAYGRSLARTDRQALLRCLAIMGEKITLRSPFSAVRLFNSTAKLTEGLELADTVEVSLMMGKALLLNGGSGSGDEAIDVLAPLLSIPDLDEAMHEQILHLALRAAINANDAAFEARARGLLTPAEEARLPETLRQDRLFLSADEAWQASNGWKAEASASGARRDDYGDLLGYMTVVREGRSETAALIDARSVAAAKRIRSALEWSETDGYVDYQAEPRICHRRFLKAFEAWTGVIDPQANARVNDLMPTAAMTFTAGQLEPADFRPPARSVGRAVEDLEWAVVRAVAAADTEAAWKALRLRDEIAGPALRQVTPLCRASMDFLFPGELRNIRLGLMLNGVPEGERLTNLQRWLESDVSYRRENARAYEKSVREALATLYRADRRVDLFTSVLDIEGRKKAEGDQRRSRLTLNKTLTSLDKDESAASTPLADLQKDLKANEAIVLVGDGRVNSDVAASPSWSVISVLVTRNRVLVQSSKTYLAPEPLLEAMDALGIRDASELKDFDLKEAHKIYNETVGPLLAQAPGVNVLYVVGSKWDPLRGLPLSTLVTRLPPPEATGSARYAQAGWLIDTHSVVYLSTLADLPDRRTLRAPEKTIAFSAPDYGDAPPEAIEEVQSRTMQSMTGQGGINESASTCRLPVLQAPAFSSDYEVSLRSGASATEAAFKAVAKGGQLKDYGVIVFYTHGERIGLSTYSAHVALAMTPSPACNDEKGAALLAPDGEDGFLTGPEIAQYDAGDGWVILAACQSAFDPDLPEAFFATGRSMVIGSSVSVFAAETAIMAERLARPERGEKRLQLAMESIRAIKTSGPDRAHPAFWGAWRVIAR